MANVILRWNFNPPRHRHGRFKHVDDKNDTTTFLSKSNKTGGILKCDQFLTEKQTKQLYKGIDLKKGLNIKVTKQSEVENTYQKGIVAGIDQKKFQNR